jgi:alcohol dehydrogenase
LGKYAVVAERLARRSFASQEDALGGLVPLLREWTQTLGLKRLGHFGAQAADVDRIVANARGNSMLTNPVLLADAEVAEIVRSRL